jgi:hypothetical protein
MSGAPWFSGLATLMMMMNSRGYPATSQLFAVQRIAGFANQTETVHGMMRSQGYSRIEARQHPATSAFFEMKECVDEIVGSPQSPDFPFLKSI